MRIILVSKNSSSSLSSTIILLLISVFFVFIGAFFDGFFPVVIVGLLGLAGSLWILIDSFFVDRPFPIEIQIDDRGLSMLLSNKMILNEYHMKYDADSFELVFTKDNERKVFLSEDQLAPDDWSFLMDCCKSTL